MQAKLCSWFRGKVWPCLKGRILPWLKAKRWHCLLGVFLAIIISLAIWAYFKGEVWTALVTPVVLAVAAVIAYQQLEHARHTRCAELLLDIMKWWVSDEISEARQLLLNMPDAKNEIVRLYKAGHVNFAKVVKIAEFGESLGVLVSRHYVDKKDIWLLFEDDWKKYYELFDGYLCHLKQLDPLDTTFYNFKVLYEELDKIKN